MPRSRKKKNRQVSENASSDPADYIKPEERGFQPPDQDFLGPNHPTCSLNFSSLVGRYLKTKKKISPGELVLEEDPIVLGPCQDSGPLCLGCYKSITCLEKCYRCPDCKWPMCSATCSGYHKPLGHSELECKTLITANKPPTLKEHHAFYNAIVPLRCLLLREYDPWKWERLNQMESHNEIRKAIPSIWNKNQVMVVERLRSDWGLKQYSEDEIHTICGYLEVNSFSIGADEGRLRGLYPTAFLCAHDCTPNTSHIDDEHFKMRVWATVPISSGEAITLSYAYTLHGTYKRRCHLQESKFFWCCCARCSDNTEFGTEISTLLCQVCKNGQVRQMESLNQNSDWSCDKCQTVMPSSTALEIMNKSFNEVEKLSSGTVEQHEMFIRRYSHLLHPNHYVLVAAKFSLSQLYGKADGYTLLSLSIGLLERKYEICESLLKIFDKIEPGLSRVRAITLYEMHAPMMILTNMKVSMGGVSQNEIKSRLRKVVQYLQDSSKILEFENRNSAEGQIYLAAMEALSQTKAWEPLIGKIKI